MISYFKRPLMQDERKYTFRSCSDIEVRSGLIGYMRIDMSSDSTAVTKHWCSINERLDTESFQKEFFNEILSAVGITFPNRESLRMYYNTHLRFTFTDNGTNSYVGMRIITDVYCYLLRINPSSNTNNLMIFCYVQDRLKKHIRNATKGIRFVDVKDREVLTVRDGEGIILFPCIVQSPMICRYIDPFSCMIGSKVWNLKNLADYLEKIGKTVHPANIM